MAWDDAYTRQSFDGRLWTYEAGRSVVDVAADLQISDQSIYSWRRQDRIDRGLVAGLTSVEKAELIAARKRIVDLETRAEALAGRWSWSARRCPQKPCFLRLGARIFAFHTQWHHHTLRSGSHPP